MTPSPVVMSSPNSIQVFEYETIVIGQKFKYDIVFKESHFNALSLYNDEHGGKFFRLGYRRIHFQQYVGVIQVNELTIEILPKIGRAAEEKKDRWQRVLLEMLAECHWMRVHAHQKAALRLRYNSILEAYLDLFVTELETLLHLGLIKKYRHEEGNVLALKGKLLFSQHIQKNSVHQERFYTRHQVYDRNHPMNQILYKALQLVPRISQSPLLNDRVYRLLFSFPEMDDIQVTEKTFERLRFDRKSEPYREAIEIAFMLLLNYRPDVSGGDRHVLAILFNMNDLWEEYVYRQLLRHCPPKCSISPKPGKKVWEKSDNSKHKHIEPDLVLHFNGSEPPQTVIVDTKWKLPEENVPSDADLKQMFMYNLYWQGQHAVLLYPHESGDVVFEEGYFHHYKEKHKGKLPHHHCSILKASVLFPSGADATESILDPRFGKKVLKVISSLISEKISSR
jgi:5-methylcytosine-specific restriction enzyme subunit McrC